MKGLSLSTYLGYPESLSNITPYVMDLKDAIEDATNADEFLAAARRFAPYGMHRDGWQIDRVTDSYVRLRGCDYNGNVEYLKAKFASRGVTSSMKKRIASKKRADKGWFTLPPIFKQGFDAFLSQCKKDEDSLSGETFFTYEKWKDCDFELERYEVDGHKRWNWIVWEWDSYEQESVITWEEGSFATGQEAFDDMVNTLSQDHPYGDELSKKQAAMKKRSWIDSFPRVVHTNFNDPVAYAILDGVHGQLSDGMWENSPAMNGYWPFFEIDDQCNICISDKLYDWGGYSNASNKFYDKTDDEVRNWLADKVKAVAKEWISYNGGRGWSRDNDEDEVDYFGRVQGGRTEYPTIRDVYRIYDSLKGRIERIPYIARKRSAMKKRADYFDSMCMMTGYQPKTTFWSDFSIADAFGNSAIQDTFNRAFAEWKSDYVYLTELVMILNWKSWQWNDRGDYARSELYVKLWEKADGYACDHLKGEELSYFFQTTD